MHPFPLYSTVRSTGAENGSGGGVFITFEGIEGCGKSTQARRLARRLQLGGIPAVLTLEPGGTAIGATIRNILLSSQNRQLSSLTELLLYAADRAQHVEQVIEPALKAGKWVISDRFMDATVVYQGYGRGQDMPFIHLLNEKATSGLRPDRTFLLDCPVEIGLARAMKREKESALQGQDRFEQEKRPFHEAVRQGYLTLASREPDRIVVMDGTRSPDDLEEQVMRLLSPFLK
jgi:dTMP kinase